MKQDFGSNEHQTSRDTPNYGPRVKINGMMIRYPK